MPKIVMLTVEDIAVRYFLHRETVKSMFATGLLHGKQQGDTWIIREDKWHTYLKEEQERFTIEQAEDAIVQAVYKMKSVLHILYDVQIAILEHARECPESVEYYQKQVGSLIDEMQLAVQHGHQFNESCRLEEIVIAEKQI